MADDKTNGNQEQDEVQDETTTGRRPPVTLQQVDDEGKIVGLGTHAGKEVLLVPVPEGIDRDRLDTALETPRQLGRELLDAARQHKELGQEQVQGFRERYGKGPGEDLAQRFREMNDDVRERLQGLQQDLNQRFEELEEQVETRVREIESLVGPRVQAAFGRRGKEGGAEGEGPEDATQPRTVELEETED